MNAQGIGASVRRKEDHRFLTGAGNYTDDINRPGQLYAYILRSPHAHAEIAGIDPSNASVPRVSLRSSLALTCRSAAYLGAG